MPLIIINELQHPYNELHGIQCGKSCTCCCVFELKLQCMLCYGKVACFTRESMVRTIVLLVISLGRKYLTV